MKPIIKLKKIYVAFTETEKTKIVKKAPLHWILNPGVPASKPPSGSKVDSAFYLSEVDQVSTKTPED